MSPLHFTAPAQVSREAKLGLELRKLFKRGGTQVGIKRAHQLAKRERISLQTVIRMKAFFDRHEKNRFSTKKTANGLEPGAGMIAWLLWGGDAGRAWANEIVKQFRKEAKNAH